MGFHSLRARLSVLLLAAVAVFALLQGFSAYRSAVQQADALFDQHLQEMAQSMGRRPPTAAELMADANIALLVQIWGADGATLFRSPRLALPQTAVLGFSDLRVDGRDYRVYTLQNGDQTLQFAQDMSERSAHARALAWRAAAPIVLLGPLLMLVVWVVVRQALGPLERTRGALAHRAADDFSALPDADLPDEVKTLVLELNRLFQRVEQAFDAQRHFVADAAHELRSPLTALRLQLQALQRSGEHNPAQTQAVARLGQGVERAISLVEQLLTLARAQAGGDSPLVLVDLPVLISEVVAQMLPLAQAAQVDLGLIEAQPVPQVLAEPEGLRVLLRNLVDNAVKYSPTGGRVDLSLAAQGDQVSLYVDDSGPGIPPAERERVFDRFYRADSARMARDGSGLGLSIVKALAERNQANVSLGQAPTLGGLRVELRLRRAP